MKGKRVRTLSSSHFFIRFLTAFDLKFENETPDHAQYDTHVALHNICTIANPKEIIKWGSSKAMFCGIMHFVWRERERGEKRGVPCALTRSWLKCFPIKLRAIVTFSILCISMVGFAWYFSGHFSPLKISIVWIKGRPSLISSLRSPSILMLRFLNCELSHALNVLREREREERVGVAIQLKCNKTLTQEERFMKEAWGYLFVQSFYFSLLFFPDSLSLMEEENTDLSKWPFTVNNNMFFSIGWQHLFGKDESTCSLWPQIHFRRSSSWQTCFFTKYYRGYSCCWLKSIEPVVVNGRNVLRFGRNQFVQCGVLCEHKCATKTVEERSDCPDCCCVINRRSGRAVAEHGQCDDTAKLREAMAVWFPIGRPESRKKEKQQRRQVFLIFHSSVANNQSTNKPSHVTTTTCKMNLK